MWTALTWPVLRDPDIACQVESLRTDTLRFLLLITSLGLLGWHIASTDQAPPEALVYHWEVVVVAASGLGMTSALLGRRSRLAVWCFLGTSVLSITAATWIFSAPTVVALYPLLTLVAVVLLDPLAGVVVSAGCVALLIALRVVGVFVFLPPERIWETACVSGVTVAVAWTLGRNLVIAVEWSLSSYASAARSADEAQRHRAELVQALKQLDAAYYRLERANAALGMAWKAAEAAERAKSEFVTNISHELRTPLNLIMGFSETILMSPESYDVPLPAVYRGDLNAVYRSAQHLLTLTNDVIDLARVGIGRLALAREPVDLAQLINDACSLVGEYVATKNLWLRIEQPPGIPPLLVDRLRIRQVLLNLVTNAVRFTECGGITVSTTLESDSVVVRVADTGCGIAPDDQQKVFDEFYHAAPADKPSDPWRGMGYGLGLPISKRLIELHGGTIGVESTPGVGTTFWFTLPLSTDGEAAQPNSWRWAGLPTVVQSHGRVAVVVGVDQRFADFLQRHLRATHVITTSDLSCAVDAAIEHRASAIIADPETIGDVDVGTLPVPICLAPLPHSQRVTARLGVTAYLTKPVTRTDLQNTLRQLERPVHRVLVVDDDPRFLRLMVRMLKSVSESGSFEILRACNGQEALEQMGEARPDLVLLDLVMPEGGGLEVIATMRQSLDLASVPVVIVSAQDQLDRHVRFDGSLSIKKPEGFGLEELLRTIDAVLGNLEPPQRYLHETG